MENKETKNKVEELNDEELDGVAGGTGEWTKMGKVPGGTTLGQTLLKQQTGAPKVGGTVPGPTTTVNPRR